MSKKKDKSNFRIFSGSSHPELAKALCKNLKCKLGKVEIKRFACNELYVRFEETVRGKEVFVVQTCTSSVNDDLMELFLMCNALKLSFAKKIHVIMPHYGYARQDRVNEPRESITAKLVADLIVKAGADHLITFTLHSDQIQGYFDIPVDNIKTFLTFSDYFKKKKIKNPVVVSPDIGGAKAAKKFADGLGAPLAILHKSRPRHNVSEVMHTVGEVKGKTPIIFDDMIDTAGSVCAAKDTLIKEGANKDVYLAVTHPIFSDPATERLNKSKFKEIVTMDTIPTENKKIKNLKHISIAPLLSDVIKSIAQEQSVSTLFTSKQ